MIDLRHTGAVALGEEVCFNIMWHDVVAGLRISVADFGTQTLEPMQKSAKGENDNLAPPPGPGPGPSKYK